MKKIASLVCAMGVAATFILGGAATVFADDELKHQGDLTDQVVESAAIHFAPFGDGVNAGVVASATGKLKGIGRVIVDVSSSWDWSGFRSMENADPFPNEREVHPCALVNTTGHSFPVGFGVVPFTTDDMVIITRVKKDGTPKADSLAGKIRGGSVCEIVVHTSPCPAGTTTNESMLAFDIDTGTGKFTDATGSGHLHSIFNSCTGMFELNEIFLRIDEDDEDDVDDED
ncbi:MAG: hypothetical protein ACE5ER_10305 [Nitrospinaceae bacterium]